MTAAVDTIVDYWDERARSGYDQQPGQNPARPAWRERIAPLVAEAAGPRARVLDSGCGTGFLARLLAAEGHRVTGQDASPGMLAVARENAAADGVAATWLVGTADEPPSGPFDAVVTRNVLWTLPEPSRALRSWRTRLRPGGLLLVTDALWGRAEENDPSVQERFAASYAPQLGGLPLGRGLDFAACAELAAQAGFEGIADRTDLFDTAPYPSAPGFFLLSARTPQS
ncbi:hypothetical protein GCM10027174_16770 [Salinifilum aidingensis]